MDVYIVVVGLILPSIVVVRGLRARQSVLPLTREVLRASYLFFCCLAIVLRPSGFRTAAAIVGSLLALWGILHEARESRRTKDAAEPAVAADRASPGR